MAVFVRFLNPVLMITFGLGLGVLIARTFKRDWGLFGMGMVTFILSQLFHIPFNYGMAVLFARVDFPQLPTAFSLVGLAIGVGLSAAIFEEVSRYLVYRYWVKEAPSWKNALMFGAGHGGIEAIIIGVLTLLTVIQLMAAPRLLSQIPPEQITLVQTQIAAFWALPWYAILLGAVERMVALCFHLCAAVLVMQVFQRRNLGWVGLAIGWHTLFNATAVYGIQRWGPYRTEGVLVLFGMLSLWIVYQLRPIETPKDGGLPLPEIPKIKPAISTITSTQLEESRYD